MGVNSLPKTVTRQRRGCDLNPGPSAPESSTLTTRLPSHPMKTGRLSIPGAWLVLTRTKWRRTNLESGRYANYSNISTTLDTGRFRGLKGKTPLMSTEVMSWVQRIIMRYSDDTAYIFSLFFIYRQFFLRIIEICRTVGLRRNLANRRERHAITEH